MKDQKDKEIWQQWEKNHLTDNGRDLLNQARSAGSVLNVIGWIIIGLLIIFGMGVLS